MGGREPGMTQTEPSRIAARSRTDVKGEPVRAVWQDVEEGGMDRFRAQLFVARSEKIGLFVISPDGIGHLKPPNTSALIDMRSGICRLLKKSICEAVGM